MPTEIKVLIAGAGIAGLASAIALRRLDTADVRFDIQLFDKATELREIGASIALSPNGLRTLERLGVDNALGDDVGFRGPSARPMIYHHWKTNEVVSADEFVDVPDRKHQTARFHRAHLHSALLAHVPGETIHLGKVVESAAVDDRGDDADGVTLLFKDGTSAKGDVLVGADGLRSKVRRAFVPEHTLHYTGRTWIRSTFDASLVDDIADLPSDSAHWWGPRYTFFASRLGKNMYTTVGNFDPDDFPAEREGGGGRQDKSVRWDQEGDVAFFRHLYRDWNPVVKALADATPHVRLYPNLAGEPLESWVFAKRVTLVGDAAHTHGGAHAAGGSLALDDAWALYRSLEHVLKATAVEQLKPKGGDDGGSGGGAGSKPKSLGASQLERAFTLYDKTRRPHTTRLVLSVLAAAEGNATTPGTDEQLRQKMINRPNMTWLTEHDVEATFARVLETENRQEREEKKNDHEYHDQVEKETKEHHVQVEEDGVAFDDIKDAIMDVPVVMVK
ncbi:hypothetical protein PV08_01894 [Exophiala spinifera]|uniref:FAD-binding domain-containing protein n=1 Tax=Exophiala spinifera TaxID=91928 RepID=A0A0D2CCT7_9EURO|nr:uncharacterized protein PV08_01894 [Exophiala spinifera]KIW21314.1 hypothetical protein PV08_01894 [Exophiala spinifera]